MRGFIVWGKSTKEEFESRIIRDAYLDYSRSKLELKQEFRAIKTVNDDVDLLLNILEKRPRHSLFARLFKKEQTTNEFIRKILDEVSRIEISTIEAKKHAAKLDKLVKEAGIKCQKFLSEVKEKHSKSVVSDIQSWIDLSELISSDYTFFSSTYVRIEKLLQEFKTEVISGTYDLSKREHEPYVNSPPPTKRLQIARDIAKTIHLLEERVGFLLSYEQRLRNLKKVLKTLKKDWKEYEKTPLRHPMY
ncbi:hypothetical protein JXB27_03515 [Candidatus Woesearchaeota archaeon]|nr:hypothetical protein [Candidatus Woesearchaeota archaeon]